MTDPAESLCISSLTIVLKVGFYRFREFCSSFYRILFSFFGYSFAISFLVAGFFLYETLRLSSVDIVLLGNARFFVLPSLTFFWSRNLM